MKKQIGNLVYDTDKAEKLCAHHEFLSNDKTLYKTPNGRFFMYIPGQLDLTSDDIVALTEKKASEFFVRHGDASEYERVFGVKIEEA